MRYPKLTSNIHVLHLNANKFGEVILEHATNLKVGIDDGASDTKIVVISPEGSVTQTSIPSRARAGVMGTTVIGEFGAAASVFPGYETEGTRYTVGDFRDSETARFDDYPFSGMNRAIIAHALRCAGLGGMTLDIATGLPLSVFYRGGSPDDVAIAAKKASLLKPVLALDGTDTFKVGANEVFPEGLAAFIDYAIDAKGNLRIDLESETVGIIDIGGRTTDMAVIARGAVDHARSGSENIGVLDLIEAMGLALAKELGAAVPAYAIDKALRTRTITAWGKKKDIGALIDDCAKNVLERIMREINRRMGSAVDIDRILLVGGGAKVFGPVASQYPHITIPEDPEFANARGFAKYLSL